jgi:pSer/pThr/pTyr-binding forkhead associated (FHA) protein
MYKYDCRKCPIRNRCIDQSDNAPSIKAMIRNAFGGRTDTIQTWGLLQRTCLLVKADEEREKKTTQESMLSKRLRQIREARGEIQTPPEPPPSTSTLPKLPQQPDYLKPVSPTPTNRVEPLPDENPSKNTGKPASQYETSLISPKTPQTATPPPLSPQESRPDVIGDVEALPKIFTTRSKTGPIQSKYPLFWLTILKSGRHISLPGHGELVLGRFDPNLGVPPDIDLAYEDSGDRVISRRHAKIVGFDGRHTIEDQGSRHGVFLNGAPVKIGRSRPLQHGDEITLGNLQCIYNMAPSDLLSRIAAPQTRHFLIVTPTGQKLRIVPPNDITIGRSDRYVNFIPDVDLDPSGEVANRVSRRHAIITWRQGLPYVEDLGSGFGTRLNGAMLLLGQAVPLKPGDHIWLGGCVLAYDIDI